MSVFPVDIDSGLWFFSEMLASGDNYGQMCTLVVNVEGPTTASPSLFYFSPHLAALGPFAMFVGNSPHSWKTPEIPVQGTDASLLECLAVVEISGPIPSF